MNFEEAIYEVISQFGINALISKEGINALNDYGAFQRQRHFKNMLTSLSTYRVWREFISDCGFTDQLKCKRVIESITLEYGFVNENSRALICAIKTACDRIIKPLNSESSNYNSAEIIASTIQQEYPESFIGCMPLCLGKYEDKPFYLDLNCLDWNKSKVLIKGSNANLRNQVLLHIFGSLLFNKAHYGGDDYCFAVSDIGKSDSQIINKFPAGLFVSGEPYSLKSKNNNNICQSVDETLNLLQGLANLRTERLYLMKWGGASSFEDYNSLYSQGRLDREVHRTLKKIIVILNNIDCFPSLIPLLADGIRQANEVGIYYFISYSQDIEAENWWEIATADNIIDCETDSHNSNIVKFDQLCTNGKRFSENICIGNLLTKDIKDLSRGIKELKLSIGHHHLPKSLMEELVYPVKSVTPLPDPLFKDVARGVVGLDYVSDEYIQQKWNLSPEQLYPIIWDLEHKGVFYSPFNNKHQVIMNSRQVENIIKFYYEM